MKKYTMVLTEEVPGRGPENWIIYPTGGNYIHDEVTRLPAGNRKNDQAARDILNNMNRTKDIAKERVTDAIEYLQNYMNTYPDQVGYKTYSDEIIIDDVLYGLGVALYGKECEFAEGYKVFKERLRKHLST